MELEEKDLNGMDIANLEKAHHNNDLLSLYLKSKVYMSSMANATSHSGSALGVQKDPMKDSCKQSKGFKIRGHKLTQQLIQDVGSFVVNSSQIHLITKTFHPIPSHASL